MVEKGEELLNKITALEAEVSKLKEEVGVKEIMQDVAWQALHAAAAAACRGSTSSGGTGPWYNGVMAKKNTESCDKICGATEHHKICDADISVQGFYGKA